MKLVKFNLILYFAVTLLAVYVLYLRFIRFFLADNESIAIAMLNPSQLPVLQPALFSMVMLAVILVVFLLLKVKPSSNLVFRTMKGLFGYSIVFILLQLIIVLGNNYFPPQWNQTVLKSKNLFVEVTSDNTRLRAEPSLKSTIITTVKRGTLLLLNDVKENEGYTWNRVMVAPQKYAWVVRVAIITDGNKKRLTKTNKFYFTFADRASFFVALIGFLWGFIGYRIEKI